MSHRKETLASQPSGATVLTTLRTLCDLSTYLSSRCILSLGHSDHINQQLMWRFLLGDMFALVLEGFPWS